MVGIRLFLAICLFVSISTKGYALNPAEDGEDVKLQNEIQQQREEKAAIADQMQAEKEKIAKENASLVERIKKQTLEKMPVKEKSPVVLNTIAFLITAIFLLLIYLTRRKKR